VKGTCTPKLLNMFGTQQIGEGPSAPPVDPFTQAARRDVDTTSSASRQQPWCRTDAPTTDAGTTAVRGRDAPSHHAEAWGDAGWDVGRSSKVTESNCFPSDLNAFNNLLDIHFWFGEYLNMFKSTTQTEKGELTRNTILERALQSFRDKGFEATTMRDVANQAGVALGAAYYYFDSKDAIVMGFYERAQEQLAPLIDQSLADAEGLRDRLRAVIRVKLEYFAADRKLMGALSAHIDPHHPLSPFSEETRSIRDQDIGFFSRAVEGGKVRVPKDLKVHLPRVLWLYQMGLILFWVYDSSPKQVRSMKLFDKSLAIVVALIKLSSFPLLRSVRKLATGLLEIAYGEDALDAGERAQ
jgi:AcrR family transcriptional regulator